MLTGKRHLRLCLYGKSEANDNRHAQTVMRDLGITYRFAVPQSMGDQWWFLDCQGVPGTLPSFITDMPDFDPQKAVGYGLSQEMADKLSVEKEA